MGISQIQKQSLSDHIHSLFETALLTTACIVAAVCPPAKEADIGTLYLLLSAVFFLIAVMNHWQSGMDQSNLFWSSVCGVIGSSFMGMIFGGIFLIPGSFPWLLVGLYVTAFVIAGIPTFDRFAFACRVTVWLMEATLVGTLVYAFH